MLNFTVSQIFFLGGTVDRLLNEAHRGRMLADLRPTITMPNVTAALNQAEADEIDGIVAAIEATGQSPPPPTLPANFLKMLPKPPKECHE